MTLLTNCEGGVLDALEIRERERERLLREARALAMAAREAERRRERMRGLLGRLGVLLVASVVFWLLLGPHRGGVSSGGAGRDVAPGAFSGR